MIDWYEVKVNAAISAMQGILESGKIGELLELTPDIVAKQSVRLANCLVDELKKNKPSDYLEKELKDDIENLLKKK